MIDENRLKIHLNRTFPLKDAAEAHKLLGEGSMTGKIVLTMD
jgi:NADPH2:quinone reductase